MRAALERFLTWHTPNRRTVLATEQAFETTIELDSGDRVRLTGYADRVELDAEGAVVVVDLKTSKYKPTGPEVQRHVQLGVYQYAVDAGAADELLPEGLPSARSGVPSWCSWACRAKDPSRWSNARTSRPTTAWSGAAAGPARPRGGLPARRDVPRRRRTALPRLRLRAGLPGQERRHGDEPMTTTSVRLETPQDLQALMGTDYAPSPQQWAAITAPLAPAVVVAGAGSGKTTLMAARVVYLVATGLLRPDEVLGLTFTTKAATELRRGILTALEKAGLLRRRAGPALADDEADVLEPTVATYNAYAATLLTDHGLRIGHEPDTRVVTDAARYQLGARVVDRHTGQVEHLTDHPPTAIQNLLALDGAMSEHLVSPARVRAFDAEARVGFVRTIEAERAGKDRKTYREAAEKAVHAIDRRSELLDLVEGYRALKAELSLMDFSDQIELAARLVSEQPEVGEVERGRFKVVLLDEYQDTSVAQAVLLSRLFSGPDAASGRGTR